MCAYCSACFSVCNAEALPAESVPAVACAPLTILSTAWFREDFAKHELPLFLFFGFKPLFGSRPGDSAQLSESDQRASLCLPTGIALHLLLGKGAICICGVSGGSQRFQGLLS